MRAVTIGGSRRRMFAIICSVILFLSLCLSYGLEGKKVGAAEENENVVLGYYASWAPPGDDFDPNKITHLNYSFGDICWEGEHGNPNNEEIANDETKVWPCTDLDGEENTDLADGTIVMYEPEVDLVELERVARLKDENPDLKTLLSIGGWTLSHNLSHVAADADARQELAESALAFIERFNMDGLDVDWEWPGYEGHPGNAISEEDGENYVKLLQTIRDVFDEAGKEDYLVTIAGAQTWTFDEHNDLAAIGEIVDYAAIMAYDTNGTWAGLTGHNAPVYPDPLEEELRGWASGSADGASNMYVWQGIPANKVVLGVPFYGQAWAGCNEAEDGKYNPLQGAYQDCKAAWEDGGVASLESKGYDFIKGIIGKDGYDYYWDDIAQVPYLYNEEKGEFVSFDNVASMQKKVELVKEKNLAGIMIWDLATDDAEWNLLKTVSHGLGISDEGPEIDDSQPVIADVHLDSTEDSSVSLQAKQKLIADEHVHVYMPKDLPNNTTAKVKKADKTLEAKKVKGNLAFAGSAYTFDFTYGEVDDFSSADGFTLVLPIPDGVSHPVMGYYNEADEAWEEVEDSKIVNGQVIANVPQLSSFAVLQSADKVIEVDAEEAVQVYANGKVSDEAETFHIQLPEDLPYGTSLQVKTVEDVDAEGLTVAGVVYNFTFDFQDVDDYVGSFELQLQADSNASYPKVFHLNDETSEWDKVGGTLVDGYIPVTVEAFSSYGVFTVDALAGEDGEDGQDGTDGEDGTDGSDGSDGSDGTCDCDTNNKTEPDDGDKEDNGQKDEEDLEVSLDDEKDEDGTSTEDDKESNGNKLPQTATNTMNIIAVGLFIMLLGGVALYYANRKKKYSNE